MTGADSTGLVGFRCLLDLRRAVDVAVDVLHLGLDVLQAPRAIKQRLRVLGELCVRQIGLVAQGVLQTRSVVHRDRAELDLHRGVVGAG